MSSHPRRYEGLEIDEDLRHQRIQWTVERAWWAVLFLIIAAAIAGIFGSGPLSSTSMERGGYRLRYDRFVRNDSPTIIRITAANASEEMRVSLPSAYLREVTVDQVHPEPDSTELSGEGVVYVFKVDGEADGVSVTIRLLPQGIGRLKGRLTVDGQEFEFTQFTYP